MSINNSVASNQKLLFSLNAHRLDVLYEMANRMYASVNPS